MSSDCLASCEQPSTVEKLPVLRSHTTASGPFYQMTKRRAKPVQSFMSLYPAPSACYLRLFKMVTWLHLKRMKSCNR